MTAKIPRLTSQELIQLIIAAHDMQASSELITAELLRIQSMSPEAKVEWFNTTVLKAHKNLKRIFTEVGQIVDDVVKEG